MYGSCKNKSSQQDLKVNWVKGNTSHMKDGHKMFIVFRKSKHEYKDWKTIKCCSWNLPSTMHYLDYTTNVKCYMTCNILHFQKVYNWNMVDTILTVAHTPV